MLSDAAKIEQWLLDDRAPLAFQHAAGWVDELWQNAAPEQIRYYQGMAAMLSLLARLPDMMAAGARKRIAEAEKELAAIRKEGDCEEGLRSVELGLKYFSDRNGRQ